MDEKEEEFRIQFHDQEVSPEEKCNNFQSKPASSLYSNTTGKLTVPVTELNKKSDDLKYREDNHENHMEISGSNSNLLKQEFDDISPSLGPRAIEFSSNTRLSNTLPIPIKNIGGNNTGNNTANQANNERHSTNSSPNVSPTDSSSSSVNNSRRSSLPNPVSKVLNILTRSSKKNKGNEEEIEHTKKLSTAVPNSSLQITVQNKQNLTSSPAGSGKKRHLEEPSIVASTNQSLGSILGAKSPHPHSNSPMKSPPRPVTIEGINKTMSVPAKNPLNRDISLYIRAEHIHRAIRSQVGFVVGLFAKDNETGLLRFMDHTELVPISDETSGNTPLIDNSELKLPTSAQHRVIPVVPRETANHTHPVFKFPISVPVDTHPNTTLQFNLYAPKSSTNMIRESDRVGSVCIVYSTLLQVTKGQEISLHLQHTGLTVAATSRLIIQVIDKEGDEDEAEGSQKLSSAPKSQLSAESAIMVMLEGRSFTKYGISSSNNDDGIKPVAVQRTSSLKSGPKRRFLFYVRDSRLGTLYYCKEGQRILNQRHAIPVSSIIGMAAHESSNSEKLSKELKTAIEKSDKTSVFFSIYLHGGKSLDLEADSTIDRSAFLFGLHSILINNGFQLNEAQSFTSAPRQISMANNIDKEKLLNIATTILNRGLEIGKIDTKTKRIETRLLQYIVKPDPKNTSPIQIGSIAWCKPSRPESRKSLPLTGLLTISMGKTNEVFLDNSEFHKISEDLCFTLGWTAKRELHCVCRNELERNVVISCLEIMITHYNLQAQLQKPLNWQPCIAELIKIAGEVQQNNEQQNDTGLLDGTSIINPKHSIMLLYVKKQLELQGELKCLKCSTVFQVPEDEVEELKKQTHNMRNLNNLVGKAKIAKLDHRKVHKTDKIKGSSSSSSESNDDEESAAEAKVPVVKLDPNAKPVPLLDDSDNEDEEKKKAATSTKMATIDTSETVTGAAAPQAPSLNNDAETGFDGVPLKRLHWELLSPSALDKSLWHKDNEIISQDKRNTNVNDLVDNVELDEDELVQLFSIKPAKRLLKQKNQVEKPSFVPARKATNVEIMLSKFKLSPLQLFEAIILVNLEVLTLDRIKIIKSVYPNEEVCLLALQNNLNYNDLSQAEQFYVLLAPYQARLLNRLDMIELRLNFDSLLLDINNKLNTIKQAKTEILHSKNLKALLAVVLKLGNRLNAGKMRKAEGFSIQSLQQLDIIKANNSSDSSLLDYIIQYLTSHFTLEGERINPNQLHKQIANKKQVSISFLHELHTLQEAANLSWADLTAEISELQNRFKILRSQLELQDLQIRSIPAGDNNGNIMKELSQLEDKFQAYFSNFYNTGKLKLRELRNTESQLLKDCDEMLEYFGIHNNNMDISGFFQLWQQFLESFQSGEDKIAMRREQAKLAVLGSNENMMDEMNILVGKRRNSMLEDGEIGILDGYWKNNNDDHNESGDESEGWSENDDN